MWLVSSRTRKPGRPGHQRMRPGVVWGGGGGCEGHGHGEALAQGHGHGHGAAATTSAAPSPPATGFAEQPAMQDRPDAAAIAGKMSAIKHKVLVLFRQGRRR